jgi:hypothetical protein
MVDLQNFAELIDYNFSQYREEMYQQYPAEHGRFCRTENMTRPFEKRGYLSGLTTPMQNTDAQPIPLDEPVKGYDSFFHPVNYRLGYQIDRTSVEDELYGLLANRPKSMLYGSIVIKDLTAADLLNNGLTFNATRDLGGTALFSTAHVREDRGGTWSNLINEIQPITTETVFNAIVNLLTLLEDSRGLAINFTGTVYIYVPMINSELWEQAIAVKNSTMNPNSSDHRINAAIKQFNIEIVPLRYTTNPDAWFLGWSPDSPNYGLVLLNRTGVDISPLKPFGDNPDVWFSRLRMRFTVGYENKRGIACVGA